MSKAEVTINEVAPALIFNWD